MSNWSQILKEIGDTAQTHNQEAAGAINTVRKRHLKKLHKKVNRNIISYYSGFLSKPKVPADITDEDMTGFMMAIHGLDRSKGLDLILHTPGGTVSAAQSLVHYLREMFGKDIRAIVPQIAMSAGTMIACTCKNILMGKHSNLGPIDPHLRGIPALGVLKEFEQAHDDITKDPKKALVWQFILQQYPPAFLGQCENSVKLAKEFVLSELQTVMFDGESDALKKSEAVVDELLNYDRHKQHDRHIHTEECADIGLKINQIEEDDDYQDRLLTVHHCYIHALTNTAAYKIIENHDGVAWVKQLVGGEVI